MIREKRTSLYYNLQGACNIDFDHTYYYRKANYYPLGNTIIIEKKNITLPIILPSNYKLKGTYKELISMEQKIKGKWKIISLNPDSILIDTPNNTLNGKYSVTFKKNPMPVDRMNYIVILKNDSTYIFCTKEILNFEVSE